MSRVISIRLPDDVAERIDASGIDKAAALINALNPEPATTQQNPPQQIDRITIRIDMR